MQSSLTITILIIGIIVIIRIIILWQGDIWPCAPSIFQLQPCALHYSAVKKMQCITSYSDAKKLHCSLHCTRKLVQYSVVYYAVHITVVRHITSMCGAPAPNIPNIPPSHSMLFARNHQNHRHRHSCHHHCDIIIIVILSS